MFQGQCEWPDRDIYCGTQKLKQPLKNNTLIGSWFQVGKGLMTNMCGSNRAKADIIPVDVVANALIVSAGAFHTVNNLSVTNIFFPLPSASVVLQLTGPGEGSQ